MAKKLSASLEDYLEAIAELCNAEGHAHSKEIAEKLGVKMPSVTEALRQLVEMGYIIYNTHYPVELTPAGRSVAEEIVQRHRELKRFFAEILGLTPAKAAAMMAVIASSVSARRSTYRTMDSFLFFIMPPPSSVRRIW